MVQVVVAEERLVAAVVALKYEFFWYVGRGWLAAEEGLSGGVAGWRRSGVVAEGMCGSMNDMLAANCGERVIHAHIERRGRQHFPRANAA